MACLTNASPRIAVGTHVHHSTVESEFQQSLADIVLLNRSLADYGADTSKIREQLRHAVVRSFQGAWPADDFGPPEPASMDIESAVEEIEKQILALSPETPTQKWFQTQALASRFLVLVLLRREEPAGAFGVIEGKDGLFLLVLGEGFEELLAGVGHADGSGLIALVDVGHADNDGDGRQGEQQAREFHGGFLFG